MTRPTVSVTAERLYAALGPMQQGDEGNGWALLHFCDALTVSAAEIESLAADTDTQAGWGPLLDVTAAPAKALPYLAMFVGAVIPPALDETQQRALIRSAPGQRRGTVQAIKDAAKLWLSGTQYVSVAERPGGDAYAFTVTVYAAQVIDTASLQAALAAAKPAGLNMTVIVTSGWTIADLEAYVAATISALEADSATDTVLEVETHLP